ncbi:MAG: 4-hydroxy-3-methylbut-2-enyl diphosphate reductase [Spirochaetaceae bacterium]
MKVILAETLGFCAGVKKAVDLIYSEINQSDGTQILMEGPIIHNNSVIDDLADKGVKLLDGSTDILNKKVVVRAHGITPTLEASIIDRGATVVDGTCPIVKASQIKIKKYSNDGFFIVIAGDKGHAEVIGLVGQAPDNTLVVANATDVLNHSYPEKTLLLSQTTFSKPEFSVIEAELKKKCPTLTSLNTICGATKQRQDAVVELSNKVDAIIVVGGLTSSNTKRLKVAVENIVPTWLIENSEGIPTQIKNYKTIGVTAGASTPDVVIQEVIKVLESY